VVKQGTAAAMPRNSCTWDELDEVVADVEWVPSWAAPLKRLPSLVRTWTTLSAVHFALVSCRCLQCDCHEPFSHAESFR
jgi:hypothetical protein